METIYDNLEQYNEVNKEKMASE